jgi:hypothetical protein
MSGEGRDQGPRFQAGSSRVAIESGEVIENPGSVETGILGQSGAAEDFVEGELVLGDVESELHQPSIRESVSSRQ